MIYDTLLIGVEGGRLQREEAPGPPPFAERLERNQQASLTEPKQNEVIQ